MKKSFALFSVLAALCWQVQAAESNVKLSHVHLCCDSCVKGANKAVSSVSGASSECDKDEGTVTIKAPDAATAQKAVDALVKGGYFGVSSDPAIKVVAHSNAKDEKVETLKVSGVHLCCNKCVKGVNEALTKVPGVKATTAAKNAESFDVTGDFNAKEAMASLNKAGLAGKAGH